MKRPRKPASESSSSTELNNAVRPLRQQELETIRGGGGEVVRIPQSP
jgi:hypothetical protein